MILLISLLLWQEFDYFGVPKSMAALSHDNFNSWCPLPNTNSIPQRTNSPKPSKEFTSQASLNKQVYRLSAAVRCPTESFDDNGDVDEDPRWKSFDKFHQVLQDLFPLLYV